MTENNAPNSSRRTIIERVSAVLFALLALYLANLVPSREIAWVIAILLLTIYLFAFEIVEIDVAAISIMVLLGLTTPLAPLMGISQGLINPENLFDGFASNAVISIIAVMIIGAGLDKTGLMSKVAAFILRVGGKEESRIIPIISGTVAIISSFMQNVGATALFLPVVARISARSGLPMSRLLMPMGFCAILGGTITIVGSSPLIMLNSLIASTNSTLPADQQMAAWSMFSVTPIGLVLVTVGIAYFMLAGRFVLPSVKEESSTTGSDTVDYFRNLYGIQSTTPYELLVPPQSPLVGTPLDDVESSQRIRVIGIQLDRQESAVGPGVVHRNTIIKANTVLALLASEERLQHLVAEFGLKQSPELQVFAESLAATKAGIAEVVIPPGSQLVGKSARDMWLRKTHGLGMIALHRDGKTLRKEEKIRSMPFKTGDTLVAHTTWEGLVRLEKDPNFVVVTTEYPHEDLRPQKVLWAGLFLAIALMLVLFKIHLSVALLTGAVGMILSGVLKIEEAYQAVSWKTVFLLASLIPLGLAVSQTGTAKWIADETIRMVGEQPIWVIQAAIAVLATFFTLVISNVGATVLLVPLAVNIAIGVGADPAVFALTVAIATSNSFLIPTHQVNALIMGPGGYKVSDFLRAGSLMSILFLVVVLVMMNILY